MTLQQNSEIRFVLFLLVGLVCLLSALLAFSLIIEKGSEVVWVNSLHNTFLDGFFYLVTSLGNGLLIIPFLLIGSIYKFRFVLSTGLSVLILGPTCLLIKSLMAQPRPMARLDDAALHFVPGVTVHIHNSFPSGHTATGFCFAVLTALCLRSKRGSLMLLFLASLVGLSRIYLLQHFLIDVAAGAILGSSIGFTVWYFMQKVQKPWLDSKVNLFLTRKDADNGTNRLPSFSK